MYSSEQNLVFQRQNEELESSLSILKQNLVEVVNDHTKQLHQQINIHNEEVENFKQENCNIGK